MATPPSDNVPRYREPAFFAMGLIQEPPDGQFPDVTVGLERPTRLFPSDRDNVLSPLGADDLIDAMPVAAGDRAVVTNSRYAGPGRHRRWGEERRRCAGPWELKSQIHPNGDLSPAGRWAA